MTMQPLSCERLARKLATDARRAVWLAVAVCIPMALAGQSVTGTARIASGAPSAETSVVLVNDSGVVVAGMVTRASGTYSMMAPRPGSYRVRARRMGFSPDSSRVMNITEQSALKFDPTLTPISISLASVSVTTSRRCVVNPAAGAAAFQLWEAAQNALSATVATSLGQLHRYSLHRFERELDPATSRVRQGKDWDISTVSAEPYASVAAESLAVNGFVHTDASGTTFYAPDAKTLTSEAFAGNHCLRPVGDKSHPGQIGLAFAPVQGAKAIDVEGTLWLDRSSSELRSLEYRYTRTDAEQRSVHDEPSATGELHYRRLPSGEWIVSDWMLRIPIVQLNTYTAPSGGESVSSMTVRRETRADVTAIWEIGGEVRSVLPIGNDVAAPVTALGAVHGSVIDSVKQTGVPDVTLLLVGSTDSAHTRSMSTTSDGTFEFDSVPPGAYLLRATSARLDTLYTIIPSTFVDVTASTQISVTVVVPPSSSGRARLCPDAGDNARSLTLHGTVLDSVTGAPVRGARVVASWVSGGVRTDAQLSVTFQDRVAETDTTGRYVLCGLPMDRRLVMSATVGRARRTAYKSDLEPTQQNIRMYDMRISLAGIASGLHGMP
jgi:hypothetical protein